MGDIFREADAYHLNWRRFFWPVFIGLFLFSCEADLTDIPYQPHSYALEEPEGFVRMEVPPENPLTIEGVELGRQLFYDPILSADSTVSCATCHLPALAFSDGRPVSIGVKGRPGRRNAPSLVNVGYYYKGLFWDGRAATLEEQALHPVRDEREMAASWPAVVERLRRHPRYPHLFRQAFGIRHASQIDSLLVARALAQFQRTLISADSRFDRVKRLGIEEFSPAEKRGWTIFFDASMDVPHAECGHCHIDPLFTTQEFVNNGVEPVGADGHYPDPGRREVTGNRWDEGKFRVPTLRNIALTAPYMHDGRFATLGEVVDHYTSGGHFSDNVDPNVRQLKMEKRDKADLIAFLHTLTDTGFVNNPAFGNPFVEKIE